MANKREEQLKEITERLEQGVQELFTSERYTEYLKTMAKFHNYSFNNTLLIALQKLDATLVAGYQAWQKKFNRHVLRGEKGIQIISPAPIKEKEEVEKIDPETNEPILKENGQPETEIIEHIIPRFKVATVFDISQTDGEPLPDLGGEDLTESVPDFDIFMEAIRNVSPVPIRFAKIEGESHGYYHNVDKEIVIKDGMSESQTMKTAIHEVTHAMLHDREMLQEQGIEKDRLTKEVEAESVAYTVCQHFGLDSSEYSFPYIAGWSSGKEMKELRASMDTIRKTAGDFIEDMTEQLRSLKKELSQEKTHLEKDDLILKISGSMGSEYSYHVVTNWTAEQLLEALEEYHQIPEQDKTDIEAFLSEKEAVLIPWYDSIGYEAEYPVDFYDLEYDYDTGITVASDLLAMKQAEMLIKREEYGETMLFNEEERKLIVNHAFKLNNMEDTKILISEMHEAIEAPDLRAVNDVMRVAQAEIDALPDSMVGISEMYEFGYTSNLMLPLTKDRALELFRDGCEVFHLYSDDTEAVVDDEADFDTVDEFYGIEKETWDRYRQQEKDKGLENLQDTEKYQGVDFFEVPALFSNGRVDISSLPEGIYRYELQGADYDPGYPLYVKESVGVNHAGTILTAYPMEIPGQGSLRLGVGLDFSGGMQTIREYRNEMQERDRETDMEVMESSVIRENEDILLSGDKEYYGIYQILDGTKGSEYLFMGMDFVTSHGMEVEGRDYAFIYGGKLTETDTLDSLYEKFNLYHPEGYYGHSLSVSDVVILQKDNQTKAYYVDSFGFRELPDFVRQRMHEAEMNRKREDSVITLDTTGVEIEQHEGLWHTVDKMEIENEIFYLMRHNEFGDSVAAVILNSDGELVAQELEHGFDQGAMEAIREFLAGKGIERRPERQETQEEIESFLPVYQHNLTYAMEHGEADAYLDSRKLNIDCKNAIQEAISNNFDGMHLNHDVVNPVLEEYGTERLSFVLACTLQEKSWDGRFSRANKEWAKNITIPENVIRGVDANLDYVVESHPAVLDGFIDLARERIVELEIVPENEQPFIAQYYVVNDAYGVKAERSYQYFDDIDEAISAYHQLPNHLDKQIGMESTEQPPSRMALISCKNGIEELEDIAFNSLSGKWVNPETNKALEKAEFYLEGYDREVAYWIPNEEKYLFVQTVSDGYDYTIYDKEYRELDGGVYSDPELSFRDALQEILEDELRSYVDACEVIECEEFLETVERAEYFPQKSYEALKEQMDSGRDQIAFQSGYGYAYIQHVQDGFNTIVYDSDWNEIGGKFYDVPGASMEEAVGWFYKDEDLGKLDCVPIDHEELRKSVEQAAKKRLKEEKIPLTSQIGIKETALNGQSRHDIEETVLCVAQSDLEELGLENEVKLLGARVHGSRTREGLYHESSDVDVVLSYTGNIKEDTFFNSLNDHGLKISGLKIDINPISLEKTGTLEEYMETAENYLDRKELMKLAVDLDQFSEDYDTYGYRDVVEDKEGNIQKIYDDLVSGNVEQIRDWIAEIAADENDDLESVVHDAGELLKRLDQAVEEGKVVAKAVPEKVENEKSEGTISFYVAECMEFPVLGEYHDNLSLKEALEIYEKIPADRMHGIKGIGFILHDGSIYDDMEYELMAAGKIREDMLDLVPYYKDNPLVQKAISDVKSYLDAQNEKQNEVKTMPEKQEQMIPEKNDSIKSNVTPQKTSGKKESVLQALRERQAKLKAQEKEKQTENSHTKKKGEQEL